LIGQRLGAAVTHRDNVFHQFGKKFRAGVFFVVRLFWSAYADYVVKLQPEGNYPFHVHRKNSGERSRFPTDEEGGAFRRKRIFVSAFGQQLQSDESVHDGA
jgi:pyruvate dehydrogenase complex dehydrogenase (E1) component